jgi:hypothetical protein
MQLISQNDVMADPKFVVASGDYHLQSDSPAITYPGSDTTQRGCYGGDYPMHNLIDVDKSTGNTLPAGGEYIMFKLGASYTVTDVRLYGSASYSHTWEVFVDTDTTGCTGIWGNSGGSWSVGGGADWYPHTLTSSEVNRTGTYIKLISAGDVDEDEVFEFQYKETTRSYWRTPSIVVDGCADING